MLQRFVPFSDLPYAFFGTSNNSSQHNIFRAIILDIFRSTGLCVTGCGTMHQRCCRPVAWKRNSSASRIEAGQILGALCHKL